MSNFADFLTGAFDNALLRMGESCTVDGTSCNGVWSQFDRGNDMTDTAYGDSVVASVSISKTDFPNTPSVRCTVVRGGVNYICRAIEENDSGWVLSVVKEV